MFNIPDDFDKNREELESLRKEFDGGIEKNIKETFQFESDWLDACSRLVDPREIPELNLVCYAHTPCKTSLFHKERLLGTCDSINRIATIDNVPFYGETDKRRKG